MTKEIIEQILSEYLPNEAIDEVYRYLVRKNIYLKITKDRRTKFGDYRPPVRQNYHQVTVNGSLNKYHFLVTLLHEFAHVEAWNKYKNTIKPHGKEWKIEFNMQIKQFCQLEIFPEEIKYELLRFSRNIKASTNSDPKLYKVLSNYDSNIKFYIEELPKDTAFQINDGRTFVKGDKIRTRYKCYCINNKKTYLFNSMYTIIPIKKTS